MGTHYDLRELPPEQLVTEMQCLLASDHQVTADILAHLAEVDARKLYLDQACSSMFTYCVERLHMAEPTAYKRIEAGRTARDYPVIFEMVAAGELHLTGVTLLSPRLTEENHRELLAAAVHRSKREIERLLAVRFPLPDVPPDLRKVPGRRAQTPPTPPPPPVPPAAPAPAAMAAQPSAASLPFALSPTLPPRPEIKPLSEDRYYLKLTVSRSVHDKLLEAQALLRHRNPSGDLDVVLGSALDALLRDLRRAKFGQTSAPRPSTTPPQEGSRHIPNEDKREVLARDGEQCSFVDESGRRCLERAFLELDHVQPFAKGGPSTAANVRILCKGHNHHAAAKEYGAAWMSRRVEAASKGAELEPVPVGAGAAGSPGRGWSCP